MDISTKVLAFICRICPLCIARRRWPQSWFARQMAKVEGRCPACRAYRRMQERPAESNDLLTEASGEGRIRQRDERT